MCCNSTYMNYIKKCFWNNKENNYFNNNRFNIAVHIRRNNNHDNGNAGDRITTPNRYYLQIMNNLRQKYNNKNILFHIYSQGYLHDFNEFINSDVVFHLNEDIVETFIGMVSANVLIMSPSSFSYVAGLLSDGEVYYKRFWHNPKSNWIIS